MTEKRPCVSWGLGVWLLYGAFVLFTLAIVGFASLQSFDLVESNYYEKGVSYQGQIDKVRRTQALPNQPTISAQDAGAAIEVRFPSAYDRSRLSGMLSLYRPSNSQYDETCHLKVDAHGVHRISMVNRPAGLWKVKLDWQYDNASYYNETIIVIE